MCIICLSIYTTAYVFFNESMYSVKENNGPVQPVLALSNPLSTEISVEIFTTNGSAIGEYCSVLINY